MTQNNRAEVSDERLAKILLRYDEAKAAGITLTSTEHEVHSALLELQALRARPAAPEGEWVVTEEMAWRACEEADDLLERSISVQAMQRILTAAIAAAPKPEPASAVTVTEEMVLAGCMVRFPGLFSRGLEPMPKDGPATRQVIEECKQEVTRILTAALSQSQPAPQPGADQWAAMDDMTFAKGVASLAQDLRGHAIESELPITAILASAAERIAVRPQPDAKASGAGSVLVPRAFYDAALALVPYYIVDPPTPDHEFVNVCNGALRKLNDAVALLSTPPTEAGVEEPEIAGYVWRWGAEGKLQFQETKPDERPFPGKFHNVCAVVPQPALTTERERSARLREALELLHAHLFGPTPDMPRHEIDDLCRAALRELKGGE